MIFHRSSRCTRGSWWVVDSKWSLTLQGYLCNIKAIAISIRSMVYENVLRDPANYNFKVENLGECLVNTPLKLENYIEEGESIVFSSQIKNIEYQFKTCDRLPSFEKAGARAKIFHDPELLQVGIVTCGGLCPGLNNVIKGIVQTLENDYGIKRIFGMLYGYKGLTKDCNSKPISLSSKSVRHLHLNGGTVLGSSRGNQDPEEMVDQLISLGINLLFCVGGDGTLKGASAIAKEIKKRRLPIGVIGVPKTIDNDLGFVEKTFGFETSVQVASEIITSANCEAEGAENGVGIVKVMGRDSGFIAATAALANSVVDFCLIPEIDLHLDGAQGLVNALKNRLDLNHHAVIVVAEGAGQNLFQSSEQRLDDSGNVLKEDIGTFLRDVLSQKLRDKGYSASMKYLDPSYHIRSVPAIASDAVFCYLLAEHAVHAGMAGKTDMLVGFWNNFFTHVPIELATLERRKIDLDGALWKGVLSSTQQYPLWKDD
mgnify:CR=1 FL=1